MAKQTYELYERLANLVVEGKLTSTQLYRWFPAANLNDFKDCEPIEVTSVEVVETKSN